MKRVLKEIVLPFSIGAAMVALWFFAMYAGIKLEGIKEGATGFIAFAIVMGFVVKIIGAEISKFIELLVWIFVHKEGKNQ